MTSTPLVHETVRREPDTHDEPPRGISLGAGVLWLVGIAAAWNVVYVLFHNLMDRLLY
jgi:hypothetical protein